MYLGLGIGLVLRLGFRSCRVVFSQYYSELLTLRSITVMCIQSMTPLKVHVFRGPLRWQFVTVVTVQT